MPVPYTFGTATSSIPLSQLDSNFATAITIGNTAVQLGNTVTTLNNLTLANVTISSGNVTITNVTVTTANATTANVGTLAVTANATVAGNVSVTGNVSMNVATITTANVTTTNTSSLVVTGNQTFVGTGNRITGDFSNATQANRVAFQTSTTNGNTTLTSLPNGTGIQTALNFFDNSDPTNAGTLNLVSNTTEKSIRAAITGTGTYLPMTFYTGGSERMRVDTSGNVGIGTSSPTNKLSVSGAGNFTSTLDVVTNTSAAYGLRIIADAANTYAGIQFTNNPVTTGLGYYRMPSASVHQWLNSSASEQMRIDSSGNVGIGTASPNASAILDAQSTTKGVRFPNMTTTQKNAISSPPAGLVVFDTTLSKLCVYSGAAWQTITSV